MKYTKEQLEAMSDFDINLIILKFELGSQLIKYLPQKVCDITDIKDDACYIVTQISGGMVNI